MALSYFDELLKKLTAEELKAVDEFVAENDSFTVFTNLSRRTEAAPSSLSEQKTSSERTAARRGLSWTMALARVEYAAILAAFTTTPNPFAMVQPSKYELAAYKSLLADGARMHYWSLARDGALKKVTRTSPRNPVVLSYSRRLGLARKMLTAVAKAGLGELSPYQYRELASWKKNLDSIHGTLLLVIQSYLAAQQESSKSSKTVQHADVEFRQACQAQLIGEAAELRAGTARVYQVGN